MIDIQQGSLGAFKHDFITPSPELVQNGRDITDHAAQDFSLLQCLVKHLLVIDRIEFKVIH